MHHGGERAGVDGFCEHSPIVLGRNLHHGKIDGEESGHAQQCDRDS